MESRQGIELIYWLSSECGPVCVQITDQEAVSFFPRSEAARVKAILAAFRGWRCVDVQLEDFQHNPVSALYSVSQRQHYEMRDRLASHGILLQEADIKPPDRYLMERFITGACTLSGTCAQQDGFIQLENGRLVAAEHRPVLRPLSIDIETDPRGEILYSIGMYSEACATVLMIGDCERGERDLDELDLHFFPHDEALLTAFMAQLRELDPDLILGWNVVNFDLRCLQKCADRAGVSLTLGRNGEKIKWRQSRQGNERYYALIPGRVVLDGIELMRNATYQFENFSLEFVARQVLKRGKLVHDVDQRGAEISDMFRSDKAALARYNLEDCRLVWDIFAHEKLVEFAIERSLLTGLELDRYGGSVAALDFLYLPRLHRQGYVAPALGGNQTGVLSPGGYVMGSIPGIHDNVIVLDFKSLYPSIIRSFHVDPLALVEGLTSEDAIPGYDGGKFSRERTILPQLIENLWAARDRAKAKHNRVLSQAIKIIMNSFYGVLGTSGCRFFDPRLVSSITRRGHEIIIRSKAFIEQQGYRVIYGDTDSVFVLLGSIPAQSVAAIGKDLAQAMNDWWTQTLREEHGLKSQLEMEFETHYLRFLMPTVRGSEAGSKKRYAGLLSSGQMQFKGLESVRSDWSPLARDFQQLLYRKIFLEEPFEDYIKQLVASLLSGDFEAELVLRKRVRRPLDDYVKNVPPHVQAARMAEAIREQRELPPLYSSGGWIEYLMTTSGPEPRQYRRSPIDYDFYIDKQLAPVADSILVFKSSTLEQVLNRQIGLFSD